MNLTPFWYRIARFFKRTTTNLDVRLNRAGYR
jgi:hypothetical protein